jgi:hypothetical protein
MFARCIDLDGRLLHRVKMLQHWWGIRASFTASKAWLWSVVHTKGLRVLRSGRWGHWAASTSLEKPENCSTNSMKDRSSDTLVVLGKCDNALNVSSSIGDTAVPDIISWNTGFGTIFRYFSFLKVIPAVRAACNTAQTPATWAGNVRWKRNKSSTTLYGVR